MLELRNASINDIDVIMNLENDNFTSEKYSRIIIMDFINNTTTFDIVRVLTKTDKVIGYIIYRINNDEAELFKICVD